MKISRVIRPQRFDYCPLLNLTMGIIDLLFYIDRPIELA